MTLAREIEDIGDALVVAFHERRLSSQLDYLLLRLESAAIRAVALEAGQACAGASGYSSGQAAGARVYAFPSGREWAR